MTGAGELYSAFDSDPAAIVAFLLYVASDRGLPRDPSLLDVGCGPGRLLPPLRAR